MVTLAQRIEALRVEKGLSRPALSAALGLPKSAAEKFETGRQTPTQEQQKQLAAFFGVSVFYLRGESDDRTQMENWLNNPFIDESPKPVRPSSVPERSVVTTSSKEQGEGAVFSALLKSKAFQDMIRDTVVQVLRSPEGQALISEAVRKELGRR